MLAWAAIVGATAFAISLPAIFSWLDRIVDGK